MPKPDLLFGDIDQEELEAMFWNIKKKREWALQDSNLEPTDYNSGVSRREEE